MLLKIAISIAVVLLLIGAWLVFGPVEKPVVLPFPAEDDTAIRAELSLAPAEPVAGKEAALTFAFSYPNGSPVGDLMVHHDRRVHVVIVSADLGTFGHVHPEDFMVETQEQIRSGVYGVRYTFPRAGRYVVAVDVMNSDGAFSKEFLIDVSGSPAMAAATFDAEQAKCFVGVTEERQDTYTHPIVMSDREVPCPRGYEVALMVSPGRVVAGEEALLRYRVMQGVEPVTDLQAYLGAAMHLAIVHESLGTVMHRHGDADPTAAERMEDAPPYLMLRDLLTARAFAHGGAMDAGMMHGEAPPHRFGPDLVSEPIVFPEPGRYRVFAAFKHRDQLIIAPFTVQVVANN